MPVTRREPSAKYSVIVEVFLESLRAVLAGCAYGLRDIDGEKVPTVVWT